MSYKELASKDLITKTAAALTSNNFETVLVEDEQEALEKIKELIPQGASVQNGTSVTLEQIGFIEYLKKGQHGWNNLHAAIVAEKDTAKQSILRKQATMSDYYLGSVHALTQTGELIIASNTGSQMPNIAFNSQNLIFVIGAQKIVTDIADGFNRITEQVIPLEDVRMQKVYGFGTSWSKTLILNKENPMLGRKVRIIIVNKILGF